MEINSRKLNFVILISGFLCMLSFTWAADTSLRGRNSLSPKLKQQATTSNETQIQGQRSATSATGRLHATSLGNDELPADFFELPAEQLDLGMNATGRAPIPMLNVAVLQDGRAIDSSTTVHPGTPLEMVIYLDDKSSLVYGLLVSYLKVQDDTQRQREEIIIQSGCSLDTYIFGNFEHNQEDQTLRAKFRAFKFPDSNFVRFVGTVNVCIKQCNQIECNAPRRKRSVSNIGSKSASEKLIMTVSTILRITDPVPEATFGKLHK